MREKTTAHETGKGAKDPEVLARAKQKLEEMNCDFTRNADLAGLKELAEQGQKPFACIVACSDSRASPEVMLNVDKMGVIFVVRNAGNSVDGVNAFSVEYAVEHLKVDVVVIMGHTKCGAITAACEGGKIPGLKIAESKDIDESIIENVLFQRKKLLENSSIDEAVNSGRVKVWCAIYDIGEGTFRWLETHE